MERSFQRTFESLEKIVGFTREFGLQHHLNDGSLFFIDFILEEIFTNMVKYNSGGQSKISVILEYHDNNLVITIIDFDSDPFDITNAPDADTSLPLEDRKIGGLGIHLIKKMVDSVDWTYSNRQNKITITKKIEDADVNGGTHKG